MQRFLCCHYLFVASMGAWQQVSVGGKAVNAKTGVIKQPVVTRETCLTLSCLGGDANDLS